MLTQTTGATYRAYDTSLLALRGAMEISHGTVKIAGTLLEAARQASRIPLVQVPAVHRPAADVVTYAPPGTPTSGSAGAIARLLDEAHGALTAADLAPLLVTLSDAVAGDARGAGAALPAKARPYGTAITALMAAPDAQAAQVRAAVADYLEDVAARPPAAGSPDEG